MVRTVLSALVFQTVLQDLKAQIEHATQDREEKSDVKAKQFQAKADAESEREDTTTTRDANI